MKNSWNVNNSITPFDNNLQQHSKQNSWTVKKYLKPVLASLVAALGSVVVGAINGYPSTAIPNINAHRNHFSVSPEEMSWFGSIALLTGILGALLTGWMMDKFGRKLSLMMASLPSVVGFVVIAGAPNILVMCAGKILTGFCVGMITSTIGVYVSEISPPEIRGLLMSFAELSFNIGILSTYIVGAFVPWNWLAIFCGSISCLLVLLLLLVPETPRWLFFSGHPKEAIDSLIWLRGSETDIEEEVLAIQQSLREASQPLPWTDFFRRPLRKWFLVSQVLFVIQQLSGINVIRFYTVSIFLASASHLDPNLQTIIVGGVLIISSSFGIVVIGHFQRRIVLVASTITIGFGMAGMGVYLKLMEYNVAFAETSLYWLPLLCLTVVSIGYPLGCGSVPFIMTNELFPTRARGRANSFGVITVCIFGFLVTKLFVNISNAIGLSSLFLICASVCFTGAIFEMFMVPETKGKTLESIQQDFNQ